MYPRLGERKLRDLRAEEVDPWLAGLSVVVVPAPATDPVLPEPGGSSGYEAQPGGPQRGRAMRGPAWPGGRRSKSLTLDQAREVLTRRADPLHCYIVVSLLTGARTEELRALRWEHVHLDGVRRPRRLSAVRGGLAVCARRRGHEDQEVAADAGTPALAVDSAREHRARQAEIDCRVAGRTRVRVHHGGGTEMDAANVRRDFRRALTSVPGLDPRDWTPRELRHSFVSLLSDFGLGIEDISRLVGHSGTHVTELVYRHELRPVIQTGATAMDSLFAPEDAGAGDA